MMWSTCHEHGTEKKFWVPDRNRTYDLLYTGLMLSLLSYEGLVTSWTIYKVSLSCPRGMLITSFPIFHPALNLPSLFITHMTIVFYPACHESSLAQWLEHLTRVKKVINSIPVGRSDFFSFSCSCMHVDHIIVISHQLFSRWSPVLSPFKWNLFSSTFTWYYLPSM